MPPARFSLVADIGGTNARLGLTSGLEAPVIRTRIFKCAEYPDFQTLADQYFEQSGKPKPVSACLAVAGPVKANRAVLTNGPWAIDGGEFCTSNQLEACELVNDFTALAWALPWLKPNEIIPIGPNIAPGKGVGLVVGPGTGLGVSVLVDEPGRRFAMASEGGHSGFAPTDMLEMEVLRWFKTRFDRVSYERLLSGNGLVLLHAALTEITDKSKNATGKFGTSSAAQIVKQGLRYPYSISALTLHHFLAMLGSFSGDLALVTGATSVYIGGGIVPRLSPLLQQSLFRERFCAKGRFSGHLLGVPTLLINTDNPALKGARARLFDPAIAGPPLQVPIKHDGV